MTWLCLLRVVGILLATVGPGSTQTVNRDIAPTGLEGQTPGTGDPREFVEVAYKVFPDEVEQNSIPHGVETNFLDDSANTLDTEGYDATLNCMCVYFYLCNPEGTIDTTGENLIDPRIDGREDVWNVVRCPDDTMQCCKLPPGVTAPPRTGTTPGRFPTPAPPPTQPTPGRDPGRCGVRQGSAVDSLLRIKDGEETEFGEFPWMLALISTPVMPNGEVANVFACGASLIHSQVALTAAHCIGSARKTFPNVHFRVRAGEWDTNTTEELFPHQDVDVAKVILREGFNKGTLVNDIALLILAHPVESAEHVGTVCLPEAGDQFFGVQCMATGWGREAFDSQNPYQTVLRKVNLQMTPSPKCQDELRKTKLGHRFNLNPSFVCAVGKSGEDTCKGDGGGPLVCLSSHSSNQFVQVGIVSWGVGCGNGIPAVYTDVANQRAWINQKLEQEGITAYSASINPRPN